MKCTTCLKRWRNPAESDEAQSVARAEGVIKPLRASSLARGLISITISWDESDDDDDEASSRRHVADVMSGFLAGQWAKLRKVFNAFGEWH